MNKELITETLNVKLRPNGRIKAKLSVFYFKEDDFIVLYSQSLELSAYGKTKEEAHERFANEVFPDFCNNLLDLPTAEIFAELKRLGWNRSLFHSKELSKTAHIDRKGILKHFN